MSRNNIKVSIVLAIRRLGFVVVPIISWHLWLGSRSYFFVWSAQSTLQSRWHHKNNDQFPEHFDRNCRPRTLEMVSPSIKFPNFLVGMPPKPPWGSSLQRPQMSPDFSYLQGWTVCRYFHEGTQNKVTN